ncbi:MAG: hypothetical protein CFH22_00848 [Alphaproteobacteria bacterium MarineAlpha5_Bin12]|nr:MAG: hypothetical protein CFH22_00848 [Alphaproteobacteria bacterium MarineAlpha5_Bin12]|tara:strand:- start:22371 stop:22976 length:606 start_codon:yes stop_codon:yes gene_type:complete
MLLLIDTISNCSRIILKSDNITNSSKILHNNKGQISEKIIQKIIKIFEKKYSLKKISKIIVCTGPGSFTGLRIGISTAIGLGLALNVKVYGINAFEILLRFSRIKYDFEEIHTFVQSSNNQNFLGVFDKKDQYIYKPKKINDILELQNNKKNVLLISNEKVKNLQLNYSKVVYKQINEIIINHDISKFKLEKKIIEPYYIN